MSFDVRRDGDRYTRAIGVVVSRGPGTARHVSLTLWWMKISYHRRDRVIEQALRDLANFASADE